MNQTDPFMLRPFAESLNLDQYIDPMVDIGDITLGSILSEDSVFKNVPIIRSVRVLNNIRLTIQGAYEIKNQLVFFAGDSKRETGVGGFCQTTGSISKQ